jgi:predicted nucleic-acid-binding protein/bifunctional DNA-binding transcriptional regulator/antitoxin component of YhaV-PrlF toxin-antitoxin module
VAHIGKPYVGKIISGTAKIKGSRKGQIAIPQHIRDEMGYSTCSEFTVSYNKSRDQIILTRNLLKVERFFGILAIEKRDSTEWADADENIPDSDMIVIDENILYKFMIGDNSESFRDKRYTVARSAHGQGVFISLDTLLELTRLLHRHEKERVIESMQALLNVSGFIVDKPGCVAAALDKYSSTDASLKDCIKAANAIAAGASKVICEDGPGLQHL